VLELDLSKRVGSRGTILVQEDGVFNDNVMPGGNHDHGMRARDDTLMVALDVGLGSNLDAGNWKA
jgi:hypothetical protein